MGSQSERAGSMIVVSRSRAGDDERRRFDAAVIDRLRSNAAGRVLVVPHVYDLHPQDEAARRLAAAGGVLVVGAWLYARATRWTLSALGIADAGRVAAIDLRDFASPEDAAAALAGQAGSAAAGVVAVEELGDAALPPRWYPVLDYERCKNCKQCMDFCLFGVYALDDDGRVRAVEPDHCKPGCPACARVCPARAIMFPHHDATPWIAGSDKPADQADVPEPAAARRAAGPDAGADRDELDGLIDRLDRLDDS